MVGVFYNYEKNPDLLIENIRDILAPDWTMDAAAPEKLDYMMFSFELNEDAFRRKRIDCLHCYTIFNVGKQPYSACYLLKKRKAVKENLYIPIPLDSARRISMVRAILRRSFSAGRYGTPFGEFMGCSSVCFARKGVGGVIPRLPNAVYFSGLRLDSLIRFLRMFGYPAGIVDFADGNRHKLNHLLYDIGFDYSGQKFTKSGFYGII